MAINRNFSVKYDLTEANAVKRALADRLAFLLREIEDASANDLEELRHEAGVIQTVLRRDF
jgi:hypothetical protein